MKKVIGLLSMLILLGFSANAQILDNDGGTSQSGDYYTLGDLDQVGKLELTKIYISKIQKLNLLIPYAPFNQKGEAVSLSSMGIPNTKDNNGSIKKLDASGGTHNEVVDATLSTIIPYSDKGEIIAAILFVQNIIGRLEAGL